MDAATLTALKAHCHVDHDDDDEQLRFLYGAAVEYLTGAGIDEGAEEFRFTAFSLVLEWYDGAPIGTVTVGLRQLINQQKLNTAAQTGDGL